MYKILWADTPAALEALVNQHLAQGWEVVGGVSGMANHPTAGFGHRCVLQALVKKSVK